MGWTCGAGIVAPGNAIAAPGGPWGGPMTGIFGRRVCRHVNYIRRVHRVVVPYDLASDRKEFSAGA